MNIDLGLSLYNYLLIGCAFVFGVLLVIALYPRSAPSLPKGSLGTKRKEILETNGLFRLFAPALHFLAYNNAKLKAPKLKENFENKLMLAGNPGALSPDEFFGVCELSAVFFGAFAAFFMAALFGRVSFYLILMMAAFGLLFPTLWLNGLVDRRTVMINRNLPYIMDLLVLSMEAGLDFMGSLERIVRGGTKDDPLREELDIALKEMKMGKTRREALEAIAGRVRSENLNTIIASINQGEVLGTPLSKVLRIQSEMMRVRRSQNAEKLAGEAPVKIMFPLLLIFISVFLILFGGTVVRGMSGQFF